MLPQPPNPICVFKELSLSTHDWRGVNLHFIHPSTLPQKFINGSSQVLKCDSHPKGSFLIAELQEGSWGCWVCWPGSRVNQHWYSDVMLLPLPHPQPQHHPNPQNLMFDCNMKFFFFFIYSEKKKTYIMWFFLLLLLFLWFYMLRCCFEQLWLMLSYAKKVVLVYFGLIKVFFFNFQDFSIEKNCSRVNKTFSKISQTLLHFSRPNYFFLEQKKVFIDFSRAKKDFSLGTIFFFI